MVEKAQLETLIAALSQASEVTFFMVLAVLAAMVGTLTLLIPTTASNTAQAAQEGIPAQAATALS